MFGIDTKPLLEQYKKDRDRLFRLLERIIEALEKSKSPHKKYRGDIQ